MPARSMPRQPAYNLCYNWGMKRQLETALSECIKELFNAETPVELTRPQEQFGDYATNAALQLAKTVGKPPREIAETLVKPIKQKLAGRVSGVSVAGPGFLNLTLSDEALTDAMGAKPAQNYKGQEILVEFGDPNPFKAMHIGHLYSYIVGDAIASLLETAGAKVQRLSYHGDVGLHVAKTIWAMQKDSEDNDIGQCYAKGAQAYEQDKQAKQQIDAINAQIYAGDPSIQKLYDEGKERSFSSFDAILSELGIKNDRRYLESESAAAGLKLVEQNIGKVFNKSDGAIVYEGEKVGLHTRVFITGKGLPTYETKDLGLTELKEEDYPGATLSVIITAHEQAEYFKVMLASLKEIQPSVAAKTKHLSHGFVSLSSGKMSSRTGDIYSADSLLKDVEKAAQKVSPNSGREVQIGAVKYAFNKHRLGGDVVYDTTESVSIEGNSGPYLQYAHARARSILSKAASEGKIDDLETGERTLARKISEYPEVVDKAVVELLPHYVCTYLYELAQTFNRFYENNRVIGDSRQAVRLALVTRYADTLKNGLTLLGIASPDKM